MGEGRSDQVDPLSRCTCKAKYAPAISGHATWCPCSTGYSVQARPEDARDTLDDGIGQLVGTPEGCDPYEYWESDE